MNRMINRTSNEKICCLQFKMASLLYGDSHFYDEPRLSTTNHHMQSQYSQNAKVSLSSVLSETSNVISEYVTRLKSENRELCAKLKRIRKERYVIKEQLHYLMKKFDQEGKEYEIYEIKVQRKIKALKAKLQSAKDELNTYKDEKEKFILKEEKKAEEMRNHLRGLNKELENQNESLAKRAAEKDLVIEKLHEQRLSLESQHHTVVMAKQKEIYEYETQLAMASEEIQNHRDKSKEHRHEQKRMCRDNDRLKDEVKELRDKIHTSMDALEKQKAKHQSEIAHEYVPYKQYEENLQTMRKNHESEIAALKKDHNTQVKKYTEEIKQLRKNDRMKNREIDDLNQLVENLKNEHQMANVAMLQSIKTSHTRIGELETMLHRESPEKGIKAQTIRDMEVARG